MSLLERINTRLRQESGMANHEAFSTDVANNALMDYLGGKVNAKTAAEAFGKVANEALSSGLLTTAEIAELNVYMNKTQVYVDAMGLLGDNGIGGVGRDINTLDWDKVVSKKGETRIEHISRIRIIS